jgi:hypothetical protein
LRKKPPTGHCERSEAISLLKISISYQIASSSRRGGTPRHDDEGLFPHPAKNYKKEFPKMGTFKVETLCFQEIFSHLPFPKVGLCSLIIFVLA